MARSHAWLAALATTAGIQAQDIIRGEYFIDQDLGWGANNPFQLDADHDTADVQVTIDLAGYSLGVHTIGIRTIDDSARWSLTNFSKAVITEPPPPLDELVEVEYFLNEDPYFDEGLTAWTGNSLDETITFEPDLSNAVVGMNTLFLRGRTSDGRWSLTNHSPLVVIGPDTATEVIDRIETFALPGVDPGFGNADQHMVAEPDNDLVNYMFAAPVPQDFLLLDTLMIRAHDSRGYWSLTNHVVVEGNTDVDELSSKTGITVFPNPFTDAFTVQPVDAQPLRVILYDPQGKLVHDEVLNTGKRIDLSGLSNGAYTAFFWKELERIHRVTLIKQ